MAEALDVINEIFKQSEKIKFTMLPHYKTFKIKSIEDIKQIFPSGEADGLNWFFCSTSGVHGSYRTLDDIEKAWNISNIEDDNYVGRHITILIVHPRLVVLRYGEIQLEKEDIPYLRKLVKTTLDVIPRTQIGNLPEE